MSWLDIVLLTSCHEIFGHIAVQHTQFNFVSRKFGTLVVTFALMATQPLRAGTIAQPAKPDPLLDGGPTVPCAAGVDYAAGTDANGAAVAPADVGSRPVPVPGAIAIPLKQGRGASDGQSKSKAGQLGSAYVSIDGAKLAQLLNPPPCTTPAR
jgi:hypothetical protein